MEEQKKTLSIASLVLGIVGIVFDFIYPIIGIVAGIVGIVLSVQANKKEGKNGMFHSSSCYRRIDVCMCNLCSGYIIKHRCIPLMQFDLKPSAEEEISSSVFGFLLGKLWIIIL